MAGQGEGYEQAIERLQAALELALADPAGSPAVRQHLGAALEDVAGARGLARLVARRMAEDPARSRTSQKTGGDFALRALLHH